MAESVLKRGSFSPVEEVVRITKQCGPPQREERGTSNLELLRKPMRKEA
jgi:hypothetical protein